MIPVNWVPVRQVMNVVEESITHKPEGWSWTRNVQCKYIDVRIDMRTGACLLKDRHGKEITLEELRRQS